jgi:uncharacterized membrane protein
MSAVTAITKIPWGKILKSLPVILETAKEVKNGIDKFIKTPAELKDKIRKLEESEQKQADFGIKVADNLNDITNSMKIISNRLMIFIVVATIGLPLGVINIILYFYK